MAHSPQPQRLAPTAAAQPQRYSPVSTYANAAFATIALVCAVAGAAYVNPVPPPAFSGHADAVSDAQQREREKAFAALGRMALSPISAYNAPGAVEGMGLTPDAKQALLSELQQGLLTPGAPQADAPLPSSRADAPQAADARPAPAPRAAPLAAPPLRLAWITMWDTDAQDGDIVRIDSRGYSRTVVLTKTPATFAIPVPSNGVVSVTGIRDGEGGGITVGLASGASQAVFPIMSTGQQLGLKVSLN